MALRCLTSRICRRVLLGSRIPCRQMSAYYPINNDLFGLSDEQKQVTLEGEKGEQ